MQITNLHIAILSCPVEGNNMWFWDSKSKAAGEAPDNTFLGKYIRAHITTQPDRTYNLRFPWKNSHPPLPSNYTVSSKKKTKSLAVRLTKTPGLLKTYGGIIKEQEKWGFIEKVNITS